MGMFDYVKSEMILPDRNFVTDEYFQTKSLDCLMEHFVITKDGELCRDMWDYEWVDDDNAFLKGMFKQIDGSYRREYLTNHTGTINFYGKAPDGIWRDYHATFVDGKITKLWFEDSEI